MSFELWCEGSKSIFWRLKKKAGVGKMVLMVIIVMVYGIDKDVTKLNHTYVVAVFNKLKELGASEVNKVDINFNLALQLLDFL